jgi:hypothetical protein
VDPEVLIFIGVKLILAHHYTIEPVGILSTLSRWKKRCFPKMSFSWGV